ncbi:CRP/FNR family transcriptional regulator, anaerobic regulatory protein [Roseivivax marinus]|uniref:Crp/Fnr family transcriptional regulator n=1 Tax=Roseivivax marinus TaxID=1379903 RepID=UPI0008BF0AF5|nr:Crp/Fnr family transcriptional regulator [Roseivivax marinus]SEL19486.1 CRP/FNR family transcriptional regulator, anaerobic regulatory protein [Roseivivax marinus]
MTCSALTKADAECGTCRVCAEAGCPWESDALPPAAAAHRIRRLHRDERLLGEGDGAGFACVVLEGYLRKEKVLPDGRRTLLGVAGPGDLVTRMPGTGAPFAVEAATPVRLCNIDGRATAALVARDGPFRRRLTSALVRECAEARNMIWRRGAQTSSERVISALAAICDVEANGGGTPVLRLRVPRLDWAALAGTSVETISRTLSRLSRDGILVPVGPDRFKVLDLGQLEAFAGFDSEATSPFDRDATSGRPAQPPRRVYPSRVAPGAPSA